MSKVAVVTDSTANIPAETLNGLPIHVIPLQLIWGDEMFRDGVDISPKAFYERLPNSKANPTTSQPTPAAFMDVFRNLLDSGYDIISINISSKLSGTLDSATQARDHFPGARIELVDSKSASLGLGFQALAVARAAAQGATLQECKALAEKAVENSGVMFVVSTLEFLRRGGRIGGAQAFLGTALNLKPLLELREGRVEAVERVRTMNKATDRLLDLFEERLAGRKLAYLGGLHANSPDDGKNLLDRAAQRFGPGGLKEVLINDITPVLGTHTGPGCVGLGYLTEI